MWEVLLVFSFLAIPAALIGALVMALKKKPGWKKWLAGAGFAFVLFAISGTMLPDTNNTVDSKEQSQVAIDNENEKQGIDSSTAEPATPRPQESNSGTNIAASPAPSTPVSSDNSNTEAKGTSGLAVITASVTRVIDGDTVEVSVEGKIEKVRMIGVNTPETNHPTKGVEYFGKEAKTFTTNSLSGKTVYLEKDVDERDNYGRLLAYIWLKQPASDTEKEVRDKMFNAILLLEGYAQVMTVPPNVKYSDMFVKFQREAREAERGLWKNDGYTQPSSKTTKFSNGSSSPSYTGARGPNGETVKGNINSSGEKIYHVPGGAYYDKTIPEEWFFTEEEAQAAGYRKSKR